MYFDRASLEAMLPKRPAEDSILVSQSVIGGRPSAPFWDDLLCALFGEVFRGDFKPDRQSDVERAMLDWASANEQTPSESAVRSRARKFSTEYRREGKTLANSFITLFTPFCPTKVRTTAITPAFAGTCSRHRSEDDDPTGPFNQ